MGLKMISYDLRKPGRNYSSLYGAIKSLGASQSHCLDSVWFVSTTMSATTVREMIRLHIDVNDRLLVCAIGSDWAAMGLDVNADKWLREHVR